MTTTTPLDRRHADGVVWITLNRPQRHNALDRTLGNQLLGVVLDAQHDERVRCIVLQGAGGTFCAGDDITTLDDFLETGALDDVAVMAGTRDAVYLRICEALIQAPKPVIAAIDGVTAGAGLELACAADLRIATTRARLGSGLVNVGQLGTIAMTGRVIGQARATELYLTGRFIDAAEALHIGLVHRVVEPEEFNAAVAALADVLAAKPTAAIGLYKELRERVAGVPAEQALRLQDAYHVRTHALRDSAEGLRAFLEKRHPAFTGR